MKEELLELKLKKKADHDERKLKKELKEKEKEFKKKNGVPTSTPRGTY